MWWLATAKILCVEMYRETESKMLIIIAIAILPPLNKAAESDSNLF